MQLSLRSQLIAGVAAVGATAIAITPIAQPDLLASPQRVSAAVQLSYFANPLTELLGTLSVTSENIFYQAELPGFDDLYWPDSFYNDDFDFVYAPGFVGLLPDAVNQFSFGALSAVLNNLSGYIDTAAYGTLGVASGVSDAVFNTPFALIEAAQLALSGQIDAAIAELQDRILVPLQDGIELGVTAVGYILDNIITNATTLGTDTLPRLLAGLIETTVGAGTYLGETAIGVVTDIVANLASLNIEGAWNAAVEGLLSPEFGLLGAVSALTVGVGIYEDIDYEDVGVVETIVYPSYRSTLTSLSQRLGDFSALGDGGILNDPCCGTSSAAAVAPAAADIEPAPVAVQAPAVEPAPVVEAVVGDSSAADDSAAPAPAAIAEVTAGDAESVAAVSTPAPAKERVSRASDRAAKAADGVAKASDRAARATTRAAKAAAGA